MLLSKIREDLEKHIGHDATIKYNLGRNKYECYEVKIDKTYENFNTWPLCTSIYD